MTPPSAFNPFPLLLKCRILWLTPEQIIEEDEVATFSCTADGNPFDEDTIRWDLPDRQGGAITWANRKEITVDDRTKTSTMKIHFVNRFDAGRVVCSVGNGVRLVRVKLSWQSMIA